MKYELFDRKDRINHFYWRLVSNSDNNQSLWLVIKRVLTLSRGNGRVEAGFSINQDQARIPKVPETEIIWCLRLIYQHQSFNNCESLKDAFHLMFGNGDIAAKFALGPDKASYVIKYGLYPHFKANLLKSIKKSTPVFFSTYVDESFNTIINKGQYGGHACFFWRRQKGSINAIREFSIYSSCCF